MQTLTLSTTTVPQSFIVESYQCLIHTILFHRMLCIVEPIEKTIEYLDPNFVYVCAQDSCGEIEKKVQEKIQSIRDIFLKSASITISIQFLEADKKDFFNIQQQKPWEQWTLTFNKDNNISPNCVERQLKKQMQNILQLSRVHNIPNVIHLENLTTLPYSFEIVVEKNNLKESFSDMLTEFFRQPWSLKPFH